MHESGTLLPSSIPGSENSSNFVSSIPGSENSSNFVSSTFECFRLGVEMVVDGRVVERREGEGWSEERKPFHRLGKKHQVSLTAGSGPLLPKLPSCPNLSIYGTCEPSGEVSRKFTSLLGVPKWPTWTNSFYINSTNPEQPTPPKMAQSCPTCLDTYIDLIYRLQYQRLRFDNST